MDYIHSFPCKGKCNLYAMREQYEQSSAKFYLTGLHSFYKDDKVAEIADKVFVLKQKPL